MKDIRLSNHEIEILMSILNKQENELNVTQSKLRKSGQDTMNVSVELATVSELLRKLRSVYYG